MIDPRGVSLFDWTDSMSFPLFDLGARPPRLDDESYWKEWALNVIENATIASKSPPDPRHFEDWREWAYRFNQAVTT